MKTIPQSSAPESSASVLRLKIREDVVVEDHAARTRVIYIVESYNSFVQRLQPSIYSTTSAPKPMLVRKSDIAAIHWENPPTYGLLDVKRNS